MAEVIGSLIGEPGDFRKGKRPFFTVIITPDQRLLFWFLLCPFVYDVKSKIKRFWYLNPIVLLEVLVAVKRNARKISV
jgi:hypothetical protein